MAADITRLPFPGHASDGNALIQSKMSRGSHGLEPLTSLEPHPEFHTPWCWSATQMVVRLFVNHRGAHFLRDR